MPRTAPAGFPRHATREAVMNRIRIVQSLVVAFCAVVAVSAFGADGELDLAGFGSGTGKVTTDFSSSNDKAFDVAIQADGKIVVVGELLATPPWNFAVARYNPNGTPDNTFASNGELILPVGPSDDIAHAVAIQPDGKILVAGIVSDGLSYNFAVVRLKADSSLDSSFGLGGKAETPVDPAAHGTGWDVLVQPDHKIVVVGELSDGVDVRIGVVRYNPDGFLDSTFGTGGVTNTLVGSEASSGYAVDIQSDGKLVVAGLDRTAGVADVAVVRYNTDGSLDGTFGSGGTVTTAIGSGDEGAQAVAIQHDGKILVAGGSHNGSNSDFALVRYESDGSLDTDFGSGGKVTHPVGSGDDTAWDLCIQPDGRIIVVGTSHNGTDFDPVVARFLPDGSIDPSFGTEGVVIQNNGADFARSSAAVQLDGKLVVAGIDGAGSGRDFLVFRLDAFDTILFEDFESDYGNGDSITNYHGWQGDGLAVATFSAAHSGTLGGYVPWGSAVSIATDSDGQPDTEPVWTDLYARMHFREAGDAPSVGAGETAVFYFDTNGYAVVYDGATSEWQTVTNDAAGNAATPVSTGEWVRVSVLQNYQSKKWALMLDDHVHAQQLGFADDSVTETSAFATENTRHFDDLSIARDYPRSLSGDNTDGDGLRDVWELHFLDTIAYGPLDDFDNDGAPNIVEMNAGTDPSDPNSLPDHPGTIFRLK